MPLTATTKTKFSVVIDKQSFPALFVINREPIDFIKNRPALLNMQVEMTMSDYPFLHQDSWLDCTQIIRSLDVDSMVNEIIEDRERLLGTINTGTRQRIIQVATNASTYSAVDKRMILDSLDIES